MGSPPDVFSPEVRAAYIEALGDPAHARAIWRECGAAATIDRQHDQTDRAAGRRTSCPLLVSWSAQGPLGAWYARESGPVGRWQEWSTNVRGQAIEAGHFFPEEVSR